jgi:hypothetical protein
MFYLELPIVYDIEGKHVEEIRVFTSPAQELKKSAPQIANLEIPLVETNLLPSVANSPLHFECAMVVDDSALTRKMLVKSISNYFTTILQVDSLASSVLTGF